MCHIDLSNCFWSLQMPREFWGAFRVSDGEGGCWLSGVCPSDGSTAPSCASAC